ncbi:uncharacterized protein LOC132740657, partial [Ruditapes philippinarum]|uniref:uncharacterized protein LOC132740657 n=1 Tax=Ruditapes philippinarum TaxID=129788 RepID=UPI00295C357E
STGLIAGVCVGCIGVIVTAVAVGVYVWLTLKKKRKSGIEPQSNGNANIELQLNNNPVGHSRISIRNVSPSLSHNSHDMPPPYSPSLTRPAQGPGLNPTRPVSGHSQTSQVSCINEPDRIGKPSLQPPPYRQNRKTISTATPIHCTNNEVTGTCRATSSACIHVSTITGKKSCTVKGLVDSLYEYIIQKYQCACNGVYMTFINRLQ